MADGEVRGGVPESLRQRQSSQRRTGCLLPVLQQPETPSGPGLPDPSKVLHGVGNPPAEELRTGEGPPEQVLVSSEQVLVSSEQVLVSSEQVLVSSAGAAGLSHNSTSILSNRWGPPHRLGKLLTSKTAAFC